MKKKNRLISFWIIFGSINLITFFVGFIVLFIKIVLPVTVFVIARGDYCKTGIENFSPYNSLGLTHYITLRDETKESFFSQYQYNNIYYKYQYKLNRSVYNETVMIVADYSDEIFEEVKKDIISQKGYGDYITTYNGFVFNYNNTYGIFLSNDNNDVDIDCEKPYIGWLNCVGINEEIKSIVFIGFYYEERDYLFYSEKYNNYNFITWDLFFSEFFSEI